MKILIVNDCMNAGGTEKLIKDICNLYNKNNIDLYLATFTKGEWDYIVDGNVSGHYYFEKKRNSNGLMNKVCKYFFNMPQYQVLKENFDVCIVFKQLCYETMRYVKAKKYILWVHEDYAYNVLYESKKWWKRKLAYKHKKKILKNYNAIVACSANAKESYEKYYKLHDLFVIKNSINEIEINDKCEETVDLPISFKENYMVNVSSLSDTIEGYGKRVDLLIQLFYQCLQYNNDLKLIIIGCGKLKYDLENLINDLKINDKCILLGKIDNPYPYIKNASLMLSASNAESFGLSVAESMYLGVPVVCFYNRGISDFINNGQNSIVVDNNEDFVNEIIKVNHDNDYKIKLSLNAKKSMESNADILGYVKKIEQLAFKVLVGE